MAQKTVQRVFLGAGTGEVEIQYDDGDTKAYNLDQNLVAEEDVNGGISIQVFGQTLGFGSLAPLVTISGGYVVGEELEATLPTGWAGSFQWLRDNTPIQDATSSTYTLVEDDAATVVSVTVSGLTYVAVGQEVAPAPEEPEE